MEGIKLAYGFLRGGLPVHFPFRRIHYFFPVALILMTSVLIAFEADYHIAMTESCKAKALSQITPDQLMGVRV